MPRGDDEVAGVAHARVLRATRLLADYADCDRVMLAEMGLAGRMIELEPALFVRREHAARSVRQYNSRQTRSESNSVPMQ